MSNKLITITITDQSVSLTRAGFETPAIPLHSNKLSDLVTTIGSPAELLVAPYTFASDSPIYRSVRAMFLQDNTVDKVKLIKRTNDVEFKATLTVASAVEGHNYQFELGGQSFSYTGDTGDSVADIAAGLLAAPNTPGALTDLTIVDNTDGTITITNATAGAYPTIKLISPADKLTWLDVSAEDATAGTSAGLAADLTAAKNYDPDFFAVCTLAHSEAEIEAAAAWVADSGNGSHMHYAGTSNTVIKTAVHSDTSPSANDFAAEAKNQTQNKNFLFWSQDSSEAAAFAYAGMFLPKQPGTATANIQRLVGVSPSNLTVAEQNNLIAKNVTYQASLFGVPSTCGGKASGGDPMDKVRSIFYLEARLKEADAELKLSRDKIPFTDAGVNTLVAAYQAVLDDAVAIGMLANDPAPRVTAPLVANISAADRAARCLPNVVATARLAGAIEKVDLQFIITQ